jgi:hypothetical protein
MFCRTLNKICPRSPVSLGSFVEHFGIWSIVPPLLAIGLAFATKQVLPSLFISIWVGATFIDEG